MYEKRIDDVQADREGKRPEFLKAGNTQKRGGLCIWRLLEAMKETKGNQKKNHAAITRPSLRPLMLSHRLGAMRRTEEPVLETEVESDGARVQ